MKPFVGASSSLTNPNFEDGQVPDQSLASCKFVVESTSTVAVVSSVEMHYWGQVVAFDRLVVPVLGLVFHSHLVVDPLLEALLPCNSSLTIHFDIPVISLECWTKIQTPN